MRDFFADKALVFRLRLERLWKAANTAIVPPPSIIPPAKLTISNRGRKVAIFSRQLASMLGGGVPLLRTLDVLYEQLEYEDPTLSYVLSRISGQLATGHTFSKAVSNYPKIFPPVVPYLLHTGESTGRLYEVIRRLADLLENEEHLVKKVRGALVYPVFVLTLTFVLTLVLFSTVLPSFADFYAGLEVELPLLTSALMKITALVTTSWFWFFGLLILAVTVHLVKRSWGIPEHRLLMYQALITIPLVGPLLIESCLARYCWVLELTLDAGLEMMKSVRLAAQASGSSTIQADQKRVVEGLTEGDQLSQLYRMRDHIYPPVLYQMTSLGEESSRMSECFGRTGKWFEDSVENRLSAFNAALEPLLMGMVSLIVGSIVVAVFMPLYGLLEKLSG